MHLQAERVGILAPSTAMNFLPESNPQIRALARIAAQKIKALRTKNEAQIEAVYREFQSQSNAIRNGETSADSLHTSSAGTHPTTDEQS